MVVVAALLLRVAVAILAEAAVHVHHIAVAEEVLLAHLAVAAVAVEVLLVHPAVAAVVVAVAAEEDK